jgi:hypothetical protein
VIAFVCGRASEGATNSARQVNGLIGKLLIVNEVYNRPRSLYECESQEFERINFLLGRAVMARLGMRLLTR